MAVADLWLTSRYVSIPAIPAPVHSDDELREWFTSVVLPSRELWVIEANEGLVALLVLDKGWVTQLYVDANWTGRGLGHGSSTSQRSSTPTASISGPSRAMSERGGSTSSTSSLCWSRLTVPTRRAHPTSTATQHT
jgi:hypothetical protein